MMREKIVQNLVIVLSAVAMLAALVLVGRTAYQAMGGIPQETTQQETTQPAQTTVPTEVPAEVTEAPTTEPAVEETTAPAETAPPTVPETVPPTVPETEPPKITIDAVPQYFQNDYPDDRYDKGTIADSGSGMTGLAMVTSYMTNHTYTPDVVADILAEF